MYPCFRSDMDRLTITFDTNPNCYRTLSYYAYTLVVIEGVRYLVHDEVGMPEEAVDAVVEIDADIVFIFLKAEMAEVEVL